MTKVQENHILDICDKLCQSLFSGNADLRLISPFLSSFLSSLSFLAFFHPFLFPLYSCANQEQNWKFSIYCRDIYSIGLKTTIADVLDSVGASVAQRLSNPLTNGIAQVNALICIYPYFNWQIFIWSTERNSWCQIGVSWHFEWLEFFFFFSFSLSISAYLIFLKFKCDAIFD